MLWGEYPFCVYGYGFCEPEPPPPEQWIQWLLEILNFGFGNMDIINDIFIHTLMPSFVGSLTACIICYMFMRRYLESKDDSNLQETLSQVETVYYNKFDQQRGQSGDIENEPPPQKLVTESYKNIQNMSIMEAGCFYENWAYFHPTKEQDQHPQPQSQAPSGDQQITSGMLQTYQVLPKARTLQYKSKYFDVSMIRLWNSLIDFFLQCNGILIDEVYITPQDKIILHQFPRGKLNPCLTPYGMKLESVLRMCGIPHDIVFDCDSSGPWISLDGETFIGFQNCMKFLQKNFSMSMNDHCVSVEKKVPARYINVLLEFHLYWAVTIWEWMVGEGKEVFSDKSNYTPVSCVMQEVINAMENTNYPYSIGKMSANEIINTIRDDLIVLTASLGHKKYFIGNCLTDIDCSAFAILSQLLWSKPNSPLEQLIQDYPSLVNYCLRIRQLVWSDWDEHIVKPKTKMLSSNNEMILYSQGSEDKSGQPMIMVGLVWLGVRIQALYFKAFNHILSTRVTFFSRIQALKFTNGRRQLNAENLIQSSISTQTLSLRRILILLGLSATATAVFYGIWYAYECYSFNQELIVQINSEDSEVSFDSISMSDM